MTITGRYMMQPTRMALKQSLQLNTGNIHSPNRQAAGEHWVIEVYTAIIVIT